MTILIDGQDGLVEGLNQPSGPAIGCGSKLPIKTGTTQTLVSEINILGVNPSHTSLFHFRHNLRLAVISLSHHH